MTTLTWSKAARGRFVACRLTMTERSKRDVLDTVRRSRFVIRCAIAASLAYAIATLVGLPEPVWAPMSALVVSQESVSATVASIYGRSAGTLIGVIVALLVNWLSRMAGVTLALQIAIAVALCAIVAMGRPTIRVCLWTCPLVLVTAASGPAPEIVAMFRGSEVVLGGIVGGLTHIVENAIRPAEMLSRLGGRLRRKRDHQC